MENPADLIRRARQNVRPEAAEKPQQTKSVPKPVSHHASYTNLMRNHDRVRTQHLRGQS